MAYILYTPYHLHNKNKLYNHNKFLTSKSGLIYV